MIMPGHTTYRTVCAGCKNWLRDRGVSYCGLSGKNLSEYYEIDECVNHTERKENGQPDIDRIAR